MPTRRGKSKKAAKEAPAAPVVEPGSAVWHKNEGNQRFSIGDFKGAIASYSEAISMDGGVKEFYGNRSTAYSALGTIKAFKDALADAEKAIELDPTWAKAHYRKGMALQGLGQYRLAKTCLDEGARLNPDSSDFTEALEALAKMGITDKAAEIEKEAVPLDEVDGAGAGAGAGSGASTGEAGSGEVMRKLADEEDKFEKLEQWLADAGAKFPHLYMKRYSENYRGVHVRSHIARESELLAVPSKCLITVEMGKDCPIGRKMVAANVDVSATKHCFVAVFVLWDRCNKDSFFQPYYRILPTAYDTMPIFWSKDQLKWLEGSYLLQQISDRKRNIKADYDEIARAAPEFLEYTLEEFSWARMMVASRNFGITLGKNKTDALVPLADMLNHYRPRETKWTFDNSKDSFTITSLTRLSAGHQVYDSYGKKCNSRFLLNYGFAVEENVDPDGQCHNEVRLLFSLRPEEDDTWRTTKVGLLNGASTSRGIRVSTWLDHDSTAEAFSFLRFIWAEDKEIMVLPHFDETTDLGKKPIRPISCENEILVLRALAGLCSRQLAKYPTSLEEDLATLEAGTYPFGSNRRNAIVILKGEKEVCHHYIDLAEFAIPLLELPSWKDGKKMVQKLSNKQRTAFGTYLSKVVQPLVRRKASGPASARK